MGLRCGIVGLPNVGKSTIFNALTRAKAAASNYPFCTIDPNVGIVPVPDTRLAKLTELVPTEKVVPTVIEFFDIAGLVKGASKGEGLGNQFLGHIAQVDALVHVVRCFEDSQVIHVDGSISPKRDVEIVNTELILKDINAISSVMTKLDKQVKSGDKKAAETVQVLKSVMETLDNGKPARSLVQGLSSEKRKLIKYFNLLTDKPLLYVANVSEEDINKEHNPLLDALNEEAVKENIPVVKICGAIESQISELDNEQERKEYMEVAGLKEPGLNKLIHVGYDLLNLITFFTVGEKENRAWTVARGSSAPEAAGEIHTDFQRGFIRAEVIGFDDFLACKSESAAREQGKLRLEGKEYIVQDGDLMHFRFSV